MYSEAIRSQSHATLSMLQQAVVKCPPDLWNRPDDKNKVWQVAYHALFYTHLYMQPALEDFEPWPGHKPESENWGNESGQANSESETHPLYTMDDVLLYLDFCRQQIDSLMPTLDLGAASGFHWLPMSKLELQFYSIRHLQHHAGELAERLWVEAGIEVEWVAAG